MTTTQNSSSQSEMTPASALQMLEDGNRRFRENRRLDRDMTQQVAATSGGQWPFAVVLSCIDSRAAPELILDTGIGDIFAVRLAGNLVDGNVIGSTEFGCQVAGSVLVVVMGHTACGAIKGACDSVELGHLTGLLAHLKPAVDGVPEPADPTERTSKNKDFVVAAARKNVELGVAALRDQSQVLRDLEGAGKIQIVGAMYDVETGEVEFGIG